MPVMKKPAIGNKMRSARGNSGRRESLAAKSETSENGGARQSGRPRVPEVDDAILDAALAQMAEQGYQRMSLDSVAKVAGVGKATIYRRWSSKAEVAIAALSKRIDSEPQLKQKAFSKEALVSTLMAIRERLLQPNNMALVGTLLAEEKQTPELITLFRERVWHRRSSMIRSVLEQGQGEGRIAMDVDLDIVIDMIIGSMYASYLRRDTIPADWPERAVETIWRGICISKGGRKKLKG